MPPPSGAVRVSSAPPPSVTEAAPTTMPIRISGAMLAGVAGGPIVGRAHAAATSATPSASRGERSAAVVAEPELEPKVPGLEEGDDPLKLVLRGAGDPELIALDRRLDLLEAALLDRLLDFLGGVLRDALGERQGTADRGAGGGHHLTGLEVF